MPRYCFHVRESDNFVGGPEGTECADDEHARVEAAVGVRDIMVEYIRKGLDVSGWVYEIVDEQGRPVMTVPFSEAVQRATP